MPDVTNNKIISIAEQIICDVFIFLFLYTAISKFHEFHAFSTVLAKSPLIGNLSSIIAPVLPAIELLAVLLLLLPRTRRLGLYACFVLMCLFTLYVGYMIAFSSHLPCSCGGVIRKMSWRQHLFFNLGFTVLGAVGIFLEKKKDEITGIHNRSYLVS